MKLQPDWEGDPGEVQICGPGFITRTRLVEQIVRELRPRMLLDIGCGRGNVTKLVARYSHRVVATEISVEAARLARETLAGYSRIDVLVADALALQNGHGTPFASGFDLVLLSEVLEHLDEDAAALATCFALLRPGGSLLVTVPAHPHLWTNMDELIGHRRRYTKAGLAARLEEAGFRVERSLSWGFPISGYLVRRAHMMRARRLQTSTNGSPTLGVARWLLAAVAPCFKALARLEQPFSSLDLGIGYVVLARK